MISFATAHVWKLARLSAFLSVAFAFGLLAASNTVRAELNEIMLGLGAELMAFPGQRDGRVRTVHLNGAPIFFRTATVDDSLEAVLDHYEALCERRDGGLGLEFGAPYAGTDSSLTAPLRSRRSDAGYVSCLDLGSEPIDAMSLADRVQSFAQTGALEHVGQLRYAYAKRVGEPAAPKTLVLTMWTERSINLYDMLPLDGEDAAGRDVADIPRPPSAQRLLSSWESGEPYGLVIYASAQTREELDRFYRAELPKNGWSTIRQVPTTWPRLTNARTVFVERGHRVAALLLQSNERGGSIATLLSSGSP